MRYLNSYSILYSKLTKRLTKEADRKAGKAIAITYLFFFQSQPIVQPIGLVAAPAAQQSWLASVLVHGRRPAARASEATSLARRLLAGAVAPRPLATGPPRACARL